MINLGIGFVAGIVVGRYFPGIYDWGKAKLLALKKYVWG